MGKEEPPSTGQGQEEGEELGKLEFCDETFAVAAKLHSQFVWLSLRKSSRWGVK